MGVKVKNLKGMTEELNETLKARGILTSDQLLEATCRPKQRKELAILSGTDPRALLELANRADLARVKGVGGVYSDLLEKAGVDTVKELATRRSDNLHTRIVDTNDKQQLTRQPPTAALVKSWIEQARELPKLLAY